MQKVASADIDAPPINEDDEAVDSLEGSTG